MKGFEIFKLLDMATSDPYVIYGGDLGKSAKVDEKCPSLGAMVMSDFKFGGNKTCFVKLILFTVRLKV